MSSLTATWENLIDGWPAVSVAGRTRKILNPRPTS